MTWKSKNSHVKTNQISNIKLDWKGQDESSFYSNYDSDFDPKSTFAHPDNNAAIDMPMFRSNDTSKMFWRDEWVKSPETPCYPSLNFS